MVTFVKGITPNGKEVNYRGKKTDISVITDQMSDIGIDGTVVIGANNGVIDVRFCPGNEVSEAQEKAIRAQLTACFKALDKATWTAGGDKPTIDKKKSDMEEGHIVFLLPEKASFNADAKKAIRETTLDAIKGASGDKDKKSDGDKDKKSDGDKDKKSGSDKDKKSGGDKKSTRKPVEIKPPADFSDRQKSRFEEARKAARAAFN